MPKQRSRETPQQELRFLKRYRQEACSCGWIECLRVRRRLDNQILVLIHVIKEAK